MIADGDVLGRAPFHSGRVLAPGSVKRGYDVAAASLILVFILPVFLLLMAAVACQFDGGPVFFAQRRIGRNGLPFRCLKFRSMCVDADRALERILDKDPAARAEWMASGKLRHDRRISWIGSILRRTSLDELPQLWNVVRGDMSLVGPRPVTQTELDGPYTLFGGRAEYLSVRPGITGLWQVSGRSTIGYRERVALDVNYVRQLSLVRDLRILLRTFTVVLLCKGAS